MSTFSASLGLAHPHTSFRKRFLREAGDLRRVSSNRLFLRKEGVIDSIRSSAWSSMTTDVREPLVSVNSRGGSRMANTAIESHVGAIAPSIGTAIEEDLDYTPHLKIWEKMVVLLFSLSVCGVIFASTAPRQMNIYYSLGIVFVFLGCLGLMRLVLLEAHYMTKQRPEAELGDSESRFLDDERTCVHYKSLSPSTVPTRGVHLYHGFGANLSSWRDVQSQLSEALSACVTSHDTPAFGLTKRPRSLRDYSFEYSGCVGRKVCDTELQKNKALGNLNKASEGRSSQSALDANDGIYLVGHSMGALCVAHEAVNHPEGISGLVLVAPALIATKVMSKNLQNSTRSEVPSGKSDKGLVAKAVGVIREILASGVKLVSVFGLWLVQPFIVLSLRWAVRSRQFWERGVKSAFFKKDIVGRTVINSYRLPQLVMGWEWGIVRFVRARLTQGRRSLSSRIRDAWKNRSPPSLLQRLVNAVEERGIRVLIIHGEEDMLVPFINSEKLAKSIPNCKLISYADCGHIPHEEMPERFVEDLKGWISEQMPVEVAT
ncbi:hypothetical protein BSKO_09841 [Bryopsis sp. KO-2023]|nr:hypothetical protein BSKO_09841 [Bryopsis sp. KO-2023]